MSIAKFLILAFSILSLAGCSDGSGSGDGSKKSAGGIDLQKGSLQTDDQCLSIEKLQANLNSFNADLPITVVTTDLNLNSNKSIRSSFEKIMAYNNLLADQKPLSEVRDSLIFTQADCKTVLETLPDGSQKEYNVKRGSETELKFESKDGEGFEYQILSARSYRATRTFTAYDVPCGSEKTPILVTVAKYHDWSGTGLPSVIEQHSSPFSISKNLLSNAAQAVGYPVDNFYGVSPDNLSETVDISKVKEMLQMTPLPEVISCNGNAIDPFEPEPEAPDNEAPESSEGLEDPDGSGSNETPVPEVPETTPAEPNIR